MKTVYIANDGTQFNSKKECTHYEEMIDTTRKLKYSLVFYDSDFNEGESMDFDNLNLLLLKAREYFTKDVDHLVHSVGVFDTQNQKQMILNSSVFISFVPKELSEIKENSMWSDM